ncbi:hypothetical protein JOQ06_004199, partial [Pogonophryne albipinna]
MPPSSQPHLISLYLREINASLISATPGPSLPEGDQYLPHLSHTWSLSTRGRSMLPSSQPHLVPLYLREINASLISATPGPSLPEGDQYLPHLSHT